MGIILRWKNLNYKLAIGILRNCFPKDLGVLRGVWVFFGFFLFFGGGGGGGGMPKQHPDPLVVETTPSTFDKLLLGLQNQCPSSSPILMLVEGDEY